MPTADEFRALQSGDLIEVAGATLRFVRYRGRKATCVDTETGARVNLYPEEPAAAPLVTPPADDPE